MARINTALGGGTGDATTSFAGFGSGTDITSDWNPTNTGMYTSGGFAADGITASTLVPAAIEYIQIPLGNTGSNATVYIQLATAASGSGGYNNSVKTFNSTTRTVFSTGTAQNNTISPNWAIDCGVTYYYGIYQTAGTTIYFGRGGTTGSIWINGTLQNGANNTGAWSNTRVSGQISQRSIASAPGTPTASSTSFTSTTLTWSQPTDDGHNLTTGTWTNANVTGCRINYRVTGTSAWTPYIGDFNGKIYPTSVTYNSGAGTYSYTVTGLKPATSYDFQVAAITLASDAWQDLTVSTTGTVGSISGSGPWTATITGMSSITGLSVGSTITATAGTGSLGSGGTYVVTAINSSTSITYTATGGTTPIAGSITSVITTDYSSITAVVGVRSGTVTVKTLGGIWNGTTWVPPKNVTYRAVTNLPVSASIAGGGNPTVTCTVSSTSTLKSGDVIVITAPGSAPSWLVGTWTISSILSSTQFTFVSNTSTTTASASGTISSANRECTVKVWNGTSWVSYY